MGTFNCTARALFRRLLPPIFQFLVRLSNPDEETRKDASEIGTSYSDPGEDSIISAITRRFSLTDEASSDSESSDIERNPVLENIGDEESYEKENVKHSKDPGKNFYDANDLDKLPKNIPIVKELLYLWNITVRVVVQYRVRPNILSKFIRLTMSPGKLKKGYGTGVVDLTHSSSGFIKKRGCCPCRKDSSCRKNIYWEASVDTATHVLCDEGRAVDIEQIDFELFFDNEDRKNVKSLRGIVEERIFDKRNIESDQCVVRCVTHDKDVVDMMERWAQYRTANKTHPSLINAMVSHPGGECKKISFGNEISIMTDKNDTKSIEFFTRKQSDDGSIPANATLSITNGRKIIAQYDNDSQINLSVIFKYLRDFKVKRSKRYSHYRRGKSNASRKLKRTKSSSPTRCRKNKDCSKRRGKRYKRGFNRGGKMKWIKELSKRTARRGEEMVMFPEGTVATSSTGAQKVVPSGTKFRLQGISLLTRNVKTRLGHDITSCGGSSGARINAPSLSGNYLVHSLGKSNRKRSSVEIINEEKGTAKGHGVKADYPPRSLNRVKKWATKHGHDFIMPPSESRNLFRQFRRGFRHCEPCVFTKLPPNEKRRISNLLFFGLL